MADAITLTLPRASEFDGVAHLVLSGLAARLDLTLEHLEDLQLAFDALLDPATRATSGDEELTVRLTVHDDALEAVVRPPSRPVLDALERHAGAQLGGKHVLQ